VSTATSINKSSAIDAIASVPSRTTRVRGALLVVIGSLLALGLLALLIDQAPTLLNPGKTIDNTTFTGTAFQGWVALGLFAWGALLGVVFASGGVQLWRQGRYHPWFARILVAMALITFLGLYQLRQIFL
jgi:hypothetical protein